MLSNNPESLMISVDAQMKNTRRRINELTGESCKDEHNYVMDKNGSEYVFRLSKFSESSLSTESDKVVFIGVFLV